MTEKSNITRILQIENIVVERDRYNYTVSVLQEAKKGENAGELVQRGHSYHPSINQALTEVRERLRASEYEKMHVDNIDCLLEAMKNADAKIERLINGLRRE